MACGRSCSPCGVSGERRRGPRCLWYSDTRSCASSATRRLRTPCSVMLSSSAAAPETARAGEFHECGDLIRRDGREGFGHGDILNK